MGVEIAPDLEVAVAVADVVSIHMPRLASGGLLLGREMLARFKPGALLINCARGGLVDESALADALNSGLIAGAGVDVFEHEPPDAGHPLLCVDPERVILTPHSAGNTREASRRMGMEMADNIIAGLAGRHCASRVVVAATGRGQ